MELNKLGILQRNTRAESSHDTVGGSRKCVGGNIEDASITPGCKDHRPRLHDLYSAGTDVADHDTVATVTVKDQRVHIPLGIDLNGFGMFKKLFV